MLSGLRRHATSSWCRRCCAARSPKWSGAPQIKRIHCHGEKAAAYMADGYARASGKPGICMAQVIGALNLAAGPARRLARALAGHRHHRRARAEDQVPQGLPGDRRRAGLRAGDQVQRHRRRRRALSRHGAPGVPRRGLRRARAGAPAVPRQRGPGRRRRGRDGAAGRDAVRARAAVPPEPGWRSMLTTLLELLQSAERPVIVAGGGVRASGAAAGTRRARRGAAHSGRHLAQRQGLHPRHASALGRRGRHLLARERQPRRQRAPTSSASSAPRPAA